MAFQVEVRETGWAGDAAQGSRKQTLQLGECGQSLVAAAAAAAAAGSLWRGGLGPDIRQVC